MSDANSWTSPVANASMSMDLFGVLLSNGRVFSSKVSSLKLIEEEGKDPDPELTLAKNQSALLSASSRLSSGFSVQTYWVYWPVVEVFLHE